MHSTFIDPNSELRATIRNINDLLEKPSAQLIINREEYIQSLLSILTSTKKITSLTTSDISQVNIAFAFLAKNYLPRENEFLIFNQLKDFFSINQAYNFRLELYKLYNLIQLKLAKDDYTYFSFILLSSLEILITAQEQDAIPDSAVARALADEREYYANFITTLRIQHAEDMQESSTANDDESNTYYKLHTQASVIIANTEKNKEQLESLEKQLLAARKQATQAGVTLPVSPNKRSAFFAQPTDEKRRDEKKVCRKPLLITL